MTNRILITHLAFLGQHRPPASLEFGRHLTVVRGPSDTGKSFIADSIDYMLGASSLREIPQRNGYATILMGLELPGGDRVTLARAVTGGGFSLYEGQHWELPLDREPVSLAAKHDARSETNLSKYLLSQIGLSGRLLRRNASNEKDSLSFRDLAHLCVIDETRIQSPVAPPLTGQHTSATKEKSALKMLVLGEDDSALVTVPKPAERKTIGKAKAEVLDQLLVAARGKVENAPAVESLRNQLVRLSTSIGAAGESIEKATRARASAAQRLSSLQNGLYSVRDRLREVQGLQTRFSLLAEQYASDIERLELVKEAGGLLGYLMPDTCPFCGASEVHQNRSGGHNHDSTSFALVVAGERAKAEALSEDLRQAIGDLADDQGRLASREEQLIQELEVGQQTLLVADRALKPHRSGLERLIKARSDVEALLSVYEQIDDLEALRASVEEETRPVKAVAGDPLPLEATTMLSGKIRERLIAWGFPQAANVRFDRAEFDIVDDEQLRSAHGKGVRAVLHAAFTLGLADHCYARDLPHPGFVVLDSPLVTYKPPKPGSVEESDEESTRRLDPSVIGRFYRDVQENIGGQVIIMENTDPPDELASETVDVEFTATRAGRWGFLASKK